MNFQRTVSATSAGVMIAASIAFAQTANSAKLRNPAALTEQAPATYKADFDTSKGKFVIEVHRDWAPLGADRFYNLVKSGFFDDARFFRVIEGFMVQFGINGDPAVSRAWTSSQFKDDPVKQGNKRGHVTFAKAAAPNSRSTQVFINFGDNSNLDGQGFASFGEVTSGMDVVDKLYSGYAGAPQQNFMNIINQGNAYLIKEYPKLDYIKTATISK